jgi:hypothetical protein
MMSKGVVLFSSFASGSKKLIGAVVHICPKFNLAKGRLVTPREKWQSSLARKKPDCLVEILIGQHHCAIGRGKSCCSFAAALRDRVADAKSCIQIAVGEHAAIFKSLESKLANGTAVRSKPAQE